MLHVACVRWGETFGVEYVERLHDMVRRNLAEGFRGRFVCLTERPDDLKSLAGVETQPLPRGLRGWWNKLALFKHGAFPDGDQVLYLDLDTLVCAPLDELAALTPHFAILKDVYRPGGFQSSVLGFRSGTKLVHSLWEEFAARAEGRDPNEIWPGGDQEFLERCWREYLPNRMGVPPNRVWPPEMWQDLLPGRLESYKDKCIAGPPKGCSVVFFHGHPRPHEVVAGWVPEVWRVGGSCVAELVQVPNVPQDIVLKNALAAHAHKDVDWLELTPKHEQTAVIVGGAPSLPHYLVQIAYMQKGGAVVLATNNTDRYLRSHGIQADAHVVCDAKPANAQWYCQGGRKLYASIVDGSLLAAARVDQDAELTCWDPATDGMPEIAGAGLMIGGGSTVVLRSIALAYAMGFRKFAFFGVDSSLSSTGAHHAYAQPQNDNDRVLDCIVRGRSFKAAAWMVKQADEFRDMAVHLLNSGCELYVFGEGLIPWIAEGMREGEEGFEQTGRYWWPKRDMETRVAVEASLEDCILYAGLAKQHRCVVQAGGNVGVWPIELAKHFAQVYTFEPDPENWECLQRNLAAHEVRNVSAFQEGLGAEAESVALQQVVGNPGATYVGRGEGGVHIRTVDSMNLAHLDALILDVEGYEQLALEGAKHTIERCRPSVITCELKGHGERYGFTDAFTIAWLKARGYSEFRRCHRDVVFMRD